jgi:hypothetical protein
MTNLKNHHIVLIIIFLLAMYLLLTRIFGGPGVNDPNILTTPSPVPTVQNSPTLPPENQQASCLGENMLSETLGKNYVLQNEQFFPEAKIVECKYDADEQINGIFPTVDYILYTQNPAAEQLWQTQQATTAAKPSYRRIEEDQKLFADVNPVKELSQTTFYGFRPERYLELHYTPVQAEVGKQLAKGSKLATQILETTP